MRRRTERPPRTNIRIVGDRTEKIAPSEPTYEARRPGRPSKLTPEIEKRLLDCIRAGNYATVCAQYCGLPPETVEQWLRRGRGRMKDRPATPEYVRFARLVDEARATAEVIVVGNIVARSKVDTDAARLFLRGTPERRRRWFGDDEEDDGFGSVVVRPPEIGPGEAPAPRIQDNRTQVIIITPKEADAMVGDLLADQRARRAALLATREVTVIEEQTNGARVTRLDGLRADAADDADTDDD